MTAGNDDSSSSPRSDELMQRTDQAGETIQVPASSTGMPSRFMFEIEIKLDASPDNPAGDRLLSRFDFSMPVAELTGSPAESRESLLRILNFSIVGDIGEARLEAVATQMLECCDSLACGVPIHGGSILRLNVVISLPLENFGGPDSAVADGQFSPASDESIKGLERIRVEVTAEECPVCLEDILVGSEATRLPCLHHFHGECIIKWLHISKFCPLCRFELPSPSYVAWID